MWEEGKCGIGVHLVAQNSKRRRCKSRETVLVMAAPQWLKWQVLCCLFHCDCEEGSKDNPANLCICTHEGAISRWLMLNPEEAKPPSVVDMVRNATAKE